MIAPQTSAKAPHHTRAWERAPKHHLQTPLCTPNQPLPSHLASRSALFARRVALIALRSDPRHPLGPANNRPRRLRSRNTLNLSTKTTAHTA